MKAHLICLFVLPLFLMPIAGGRQGGVDAVSGNVKDMASAPVVGASVALISLDRVLQTKSASNGSFELENLQPGAYTVEITSPGFAKQATSLTIQEGAPSQTLSVVLRVADQPEMDKCGRDMSIKYESLASTSPNLVGTVRSYSGGKLIANAEVKIVSETSRQVSAIIRSDRMGRFTAEHLTPDYYNIELSCKDCASDELKHVVIPRENQVVIESTLDKRGRLVICQ